MPGQAIFSILCNCSFVVRDDLQTRGAKLAGKIETGFWGLILVALALPACQTQINNPTPAVLTLTPPNKNAGQPEFI